MSKELITVYKCDRCGKQMDSQYAILTLKHVGISLVKDDYINKDLCADCFNKISALMNDDKATIVSTTAVVKDWITTKDLFVPYSEDVSPLKRGTYVTWTNNDPLNKHLDVMSV